MTRKMPLGVHHLVLVLLVISIFSFGSGTGEAPSLLYRHVVRDAEKRGALCNDGTPAVYYFNSHDDVVSTDNWLLFLEGGGDCYSDKSCENRWKLEQHYMTAPTEPTMYNIDVAAIFSNDCDLNPGLCQHNKVVLRYCSSDKYTGKGGKSKAGFQFNGHIIVQSVVEDLLDFISSRSSDSQGITEDSSSTSTTKSSSTTSVISGDGVKFSRDGFSTASIDETTIKVNFVFAGSSAGGVGAFSQAGFVIDTIAKKIDELDERKMDISAKNSPEKQTISLLERVMPKKTIGPRDFFSCTGRLWMGSLWSGFFRRLL